MLNNIISFAGLFVLFVACNSPKQLGSTVEEAVKPAVVTEKVVFDTDDPAIWIHPTDLSQTLIIGTDKETGGGLYAFNLKGKIVHKTLGLKRPNNVDIVYGITLNGVLKDVAVATERETNMLRFFSVPDLQPLDGGGIEVFAGEKEQKPMGVATYTKADGTKYVIVGRKTGPAGTYLWQYKLSGNNGKVTMQLVRKFGAFSNKKEIESIAVDNELGYVYYSDEQYGVRKYYADPEKGNEELAVFGQGEFKDDNEGISIYKFKNGTGYILVSDQSANRFNVYPREGGTLNPHEHTKITSVLVSTNQSDGSDITSLSLPGFEGGMFVAMSTDKTFQYYRWKDIAARAGLRIAK